MHKRAIYPGTFDPITNGHIDVISRISKIFSSIIVAVSTGVNKGTLFTADERYDFATKSLHRFKNVRVFKLEGLLANFAKQIRANIIIRGLRAISDFEYEFQLSNMNKGINKKLDTIFIPTSNKYFYVSSSMIKEVAMLNGDVSELVPNVVSEALKKKFSI